MSPNKKWLVKTLRSAFEGHLTGMVIDIKGSRSFIWTSINGNVHYLQVPRQPKDIPKYVKDIVNGYIDEARHRYDKTKR